MLSRPFGPEEAVRACACGHRIVCRVGDRCPRCHTPLVSPAPDPQAVQQTMTRSARLHGREHLERLAPVLGVPGKLVNDGSRVFGVLEGDAA